MKLSVAGISLLTLLAASVAVTQDHHVKAALVPIGGSGVGGFVQITQLPHGGSNLHVVATGLTPGAWYRWELRIDDSQCGPQTGGPSPAAGSVLISSAGAFQADAPKGITADDTAYLVSDAEMVFKVNIKQLMGSKLIQTVGTDAIKGAIMRETKGMAKTELVQRLLAEELTKIP